MKGVFMKKILFVIFVALAMVSCAGSVKTINTDPITITILHVNDSHSHLEPNSYDLVLGGEKTRVSMGGFPQLVTLMDEQAKTSTNPILLHAGDAMAGTIYYSLFKGASDAEAMNLIPWDAFALGNHEFDGGNETLSNFLGVLDTSAISANVVPDKGSILEGAWQPYKVVTIGEEKIGLIGINIVGKTKNSSNPGNDIQFFDEIETTKKYVAELETQKINKIIVISHTGIDNAIDMAEKVGGIDVIVNGDSHTLLGGEDLKKTSLEPENDYPVIVSSPRKQPVAIVQSWEYTKLLGKLEVSFDNMGVITNTKGTPMIILSDSFKRKDSTGNRVELTGADREAIYDEIKQNPSLVIVEADETAEGVIEKYKTEKDKLGKKVIGEVAENIPGGSDVRIPQKSQGGHFTAQVVAEGTLHRIKSMGTGHIDAVIQNAGGVRIPLVQGPINTETVFTLLPFSNTIMTIEITGAQIKTALEQAIDFALNPQGSTGSFPYTAGMRYATNLEATMGNRVSDIEMQQEGTWSPIDDNKTYILGVNNYIAGGKDGYIILGEIPSSKKTDLYLNDAQMFTDYVTEMKVIKKPAVTNVTLK